MKNSDLIQFVMTTEQKDTVIQSLKSAGSVFSAIAPNLTNEQRKEFGSVDEQNKLIIDKGRAYMAQYPALVPLFVEKDEFERDYISRGDLSEVEMILLQMLRQVTDIKILLDHDNYQDVLTFYRSVRYYANEEEMDAITVYNDMKQFFPRTSNK